jgi:hypothetical protein
LGFATALGLAATFFAARRASRACARRVFISYASRTRKMRR